MSLNNETVSAKISEQFGNDILHTETPYDFLTITVKKDKLEEIIKFLKEDAELNFHFLTTACGVHFPDALEPFGMMYQLHNMPDNMRIRVITSSADPSPVFPSMTKFWPAANWMEREAYDFFGYRFEGHPDLRRILNMDSLEGWPLRKEFPLEDPLRLDKDDKMFGR